MAEVYMEKVIAQAKKNIKNDGDMQPHFLIIDKEENMVAYEAGWDDEEGKKDVHDWLVRTVNQLGSNRYFFVATGWCTDKDGVREKLEQSKKKMMVKPSAESTKIFLKEAFELLMLKPSYNPARKEIIVVSEFEKGVGTKTMTLKLTRDGDAVSFGEPNDLTDSSASYNAWNIWSPMQITVEGTEEIETEIETENEENEGSRHNKREI